MTGSEPFAKQQHTPGNGDVCSEAAVEDAFDNTYKEKEGPKPPRILVWRNVILMTLLHLGAVYGIFLIPAASPPTLLWDADPHNASRGFFFAHVGWLLVRKHPDVIEKGRKLELSDLFADKVVMFQRRQVTHYKLSVLLMCFFVPMFVPWYFWGESLWVSYFIPALLRYALVLNASWLVNSAAHMWGNRPYDKNINPRENRFVTFSAIGQTVKKQCILFCKTSCKTNCVAFISANSCFKIQTKVDLSVSLTHPGEGFHNYHHTFPYDYATSEYGCKLNLTTCFIDFMCFLGLAKDRKRVSREVVLSRLQRTGDGSHRSG
ncbi:hypothetical protein XENOCAPTIV_010464 [Xenoophorus captivus]|uniref:stearoyl-CoA 9-desaturase n=1 Tax=Xenoophorus captivus TaxID=1517983 RepID=A0ABV0RM80_9TELE